MADADALDPTPLSDIDDLIHGIETGKVSLSSSDVTADVIYDPATANAIIEAPGKRRRSRHASGNFLVGNGHG